MDVKERTQQITELLAEMDPMGLVLIGAPLTEYSPEAYRLAALEVISPITEEDCKNLFARMFTAESTSHIDFKDMAERINAKAQV